MRSTILQTATNYLLPLLLLFSVFLLLRGHYLPGGGFVGGLIASIAFVLHAYAYGLKSAESYIKFKPMRLLPFGLLLMLISGMIPFFMGKPFMTALWLPQPIAIIGTVGTPLIFDLGVYFVVIGVTLTILFTISKSI